MAKQCGENDLSSFRTKRMLAKRERKLTREERELLREALMDSSELVYEIEAAQ